MMASSDCKSHEEGTPETGADIPSWVVGDSHMGAGKRDIGEEMDVVPLVFDGGEKRQVPTLRHHQMQRFF